MSNVAPEDQQAELLKRVINADQSAAEALYKQHYTTVFAFVRMQIDDIGAVEEIVDDVFMAAFRSADRFAGRSTFKTWLLGIARNTCHNWLRKASREPLALSDELSDEHEMLVDLICPAIDQIEQSELNAIIRFCMDRLPPAQREALFWVYYEELSLDHVSRTLDCAVGTIKSRLFHAKAKMADCLGRRLTQVTTP